MIPSDKYALVRAFWLRPSEMLQENLTMPRRVLSGEVYIYFGPNMNSSIIINQDYAWV